MKPFKSILSILLVLCLLVSAAPAQADSFLPDQPVDRDVSHAHIHHDHTDQVVSDVNSDPETTAYTVTFSVPDGVKAPAAMTCREGDSITLPAADAPTGYVFVGWVAGTVSPTAILPDPILTGSYAATANITLKALYLHTETILFGYTLVDATPESWEGSYVITFGRTEDTVVLKGLSGTKKYETKTAGGTVSLSETGITRNGSSLSNVNDVYVFEITSADDKLVIRNVGASTYLANRGGYLYSYKSDAAAYCRWTLTVNGTTTEATNDASTMRRYLSFSQQNYFMIDRAANDNICFWKENGSELTYYTTEPAVAHTHSYGDWVSNHDGTHSRTCLICGSFDTELCVYQDVITDPTCTEPGYTTHTCPICGDSYVDSYQNQLGHDWGEPTYVWAADNSTVTATRVCGNDASHIETETANTTAVTTAATCEAAGGTVYTATFENEAFETQTKTVEIAALGHNWGTPTYVWAADNSTVTATRVCANDASHVETETVSTTAVTTAATCESAGGTVYTATFANTAFETQTKTVEIAALGHAWGTPTYVWAADNSTVTATRVCANEPSHVETEMVSTMAATTAATCEAPGSAVYTATFENEAFETQTKTVEIPALGHTWGEPTYVWAADNSTVTATRVCANDASHVETETANTTAVTTAATCEAAGGTVYTATFANTAFKTQTKTVEIPALGHTWGEPTYVWAADNSTVTATRVCANDPSHVEAETVSTTAATTAATCESAGGTVYTATFANTAFETQTKTVEIPALGHTWGEPTYVWAADNSTVTATRVCANDASHVETETVSTTAVTTAATCESAGSTVYTATFANTAFETQTKTVEIAALGHAWGEPTWTWTGDDTNGYTAATATFTCTRDSSHKETVNATVVRTDGLCFTDYTATAAFNGQNYTDTKHVGFTAFYLIGPDWTIGAIDPANRFAVNPANASEYMLTVSLTEGEKIKVVKVTDGAIAAWYPDGMNNEYTVDAAHAGSEKAIYFSESERSDWSAFGGYIWIDAAAQIQLNTFTHSDNFANVDTYLYRVGNGNTVRLGSLFKVDTAGTNAVVSNDVSVTVQKVETNSTVALGSYTKNSSDWTQSTLKFTGEGPVKVTIREGSGTSYTLNLEIVSGNNATSAASATSANIVLLNDVSTAGISIGSGKTLYGNGFTVTDTRNHPNGVSGFVNIDNGTIDNVKLVGYLASDQVMSGIENADYAPAVTVSTNGGKILNSTVSGGRFAILVYALGANKELYMEGSTVMGGAVANMQFGGGTLTMVDCITRNAEEGKIGLGIYVTTASATINIRGTFYQANWTAKSALPSTYQSMLSDVYNNAEYKDGSGRINTGIIFLPPSGEITTADVQAAVHDTTGNTYGYIQKTALGVTGTCYLPKASMAGAADPGDVTDQHAIIPAYSFDYTTKNYQAITSGSNVYCYYDDATGQVLISFDEGDSKVWDPMILSVTKMGHALPYTVSMNGTDHTNGTITFTETGDYDVIYTYTDPYNYDKTTGEYSVTYTKTVHISVTAVEPDVQIYYANLSYDGAAGSYAAKKVIGTDNKTYVMPDVSGTSSTIGSTTVAGQTVYYPIVTVGPTSSNGNTTYSSGKGYYFAPVFSELHIIDYNQETGAKQYEYSKSTSTWPHGNSATTGPNTAYFTCASGEKVWSGTSPYARSTNAQYYRYGKNNLGVCYTTEEIEKDNSACNHLVQYHYVSTDGTTYYYYIYYQFTAMTYSSCVVTGTLVTMADGTQKPIEDVDTGDMVLTWSFETGRAQAAPVAIKWYHGTDDWRVTTLSFSDGTQVKIIKEHGFFDLDTNSYEYLTEDSAQSFIGHRFAKQNADGSIGEVVLTAAATENEVTGSWSLQTAFNENFVAAGLLSITGEDFRGRFEYFPIGEGMKYDEEAKARDIETYGLYTYEEFSDWLTEAQFYAFNGPYFKVLVGRGVLTYEDILEIIRVNLYTETIVELYMKNVVDLSVKSVCQTIRKGVGR